ncbi:hypothetical protein FUA23_17440 [Neolewinella aurantiaca]|uniref:Uncharacterized protein n=1 Tax=Neolewinella aurantiaca TaxID=2602767 RepID=A0A5C7FAA0_9BACT|nr:hypothetical protein [Neolewinella aurantiaca]TXF87717.1 hypothetical protein FUA23_17440 [Neolewinella aurantiaca]
MRFRIWHSALPFAKFIVENTDLKNYEVMYSKMYESDANNSAFFHTMPHHIKNILYLDAPDVIVELDHEPIFSIEVSSEAGTGHNAFQRFARLAASVENQVPAFYIYPEGVIIDRKGVPSRWDKINPLVFKALLDVMKIHKIPALLYYFPSDLNDGNAIEDCPNRDKKGLKYEPDFQYAGSPDSSDDEMNLMFSTMNDLILSIKKKGVVTGLEASLGLRSVMERSTFMSKEFNRKGGHENMSPVSATVKVDTSYLIEYLTRKDGMNYQIGELLRSRSKTVIYQVNAKFRGDPYPGALAAIDYLICREGKSFEERKYNLVLAWGSIEIKNYRLELHSEKASIDDFTKAVQKSENKNILAKSFKELKKSEIPRYYMQVRYGSTYSKVKHIRVYSYFADAILFTDGALWRDG